MPEKLFYSKTDKRLFYIPDYYMGGDTRVNSLITDLKKGVAEFRSLAPSIDTSLVRSLYVEHSSRYKHMQIFYINDIEETVSGAFELGDNWDMYKWLKN